ncbi:hypothetical protein HK104_006039 [Borealophlyctis nickersoniae]|nr:hypothetical protein HK104_006039 [Borealophlyctis nickersoniae]
MSMSGCEKCVIQPGASYAECDLLGVYSGLCKSMPGMSQCGEWKSMCRATPGLGFCQQDASQDAPVMKMFFHTGISDYVLLENWVPRNGGQYAGAWIGTFLLGLVFEITTTLHYLLEARRTRYELEAVTPLSKSYTVMIAVTRGLIRMWVAFLAYILMLVVMTYNVGLFFAAIVGLGAGAAVFGGVAKRAAVRAVSHAQTLTEETASSRPSHSTPPRSECAQRQASQQLLTHAVARLNPSLTMASTTSGPTPMDTDAATTTANNRGFQCPVCLRTFHASPDLENHLNSGIHNGPSGFTCAFCPRTFRTLSAVTQHLGDGNCLTRAQNCLTRAQVKQFEKPTTSSRERTTDEDPGQTASNRKDSVLHSSTILVLRLGTKMTVRKVWKTGTIHVGLYTAGFLRIECLYPLHLEQTQFHVFKLE